MANPENLIGHSFVDKPENISPGRPKGSRNRSTIYRGHLEKLGKKGQVVDDIVLAAIDKALTGDINALKELMDSGYGKNPDKLIHAETDEDKIDRDVTQELLGLIPTEELERIVAAGITDNRDDKNASQEQSRHKPETGGEGVADVL